VSPSRLRLDLPDEREKVRLPAESKGHCRRMAEATEPTNRDDEQQHPIESEEALHEPRDVDEGERALQTGLTPAPEDDDDTPSGATVEGGLVRQTIPVA
jgi:hypothetical protein